MRRVEDSSGGPLQAPTIMMSQDRQAGKDRSHARNGHEDVRATMEITASHATRREESARPAGLLEDA